MLSIMILIGLSGCETITIASDSCIAYKPVRNYLECPSAVIDQIDVNNLTYMSLCDD